MLPETAFTDERVQNIIESGLSNLDDEDFGNREVWVRASDGHLITWRRDSVLGKWMAEGGQLPVLIDGARYAITRQTVIDGVHRYMAHYNLTEDNRCLGTEVGFVTCWCEDCLWGDPDVAREILLWGLGINA